MQINYAICWDPENPWTRNAQQQTTLQPCYLGVAQMRQVQLWVLVHVRGKTPHPILLSAYRIQDTTYFDPFADVFLGVHHILGHRAVVVWVTPLSRWHRHFRTAGARILCARAWQRLLRSALLDPLAGACRGNSRMFPRSVSQWLGDHSATHQQNKCCHIDCCSCYSSCSWGRRKKWQLHLSLRYWFLSVYRSRTEMVAQEEETAHVQIEHISEVYAVCICTHLYR